MGPIVKLNKIKGLWVFLNLIKLIKYLNIYFEKEFIDDEFEIK